MLYIFDMGGVVTTTAMIFGEVSKRLGITEDEFLKFCGTGTENDLLLGASNGVVDAREFWKEFSGRSGIKVTTDWLHYLFHPENIEGTRELIAALKKLGHRVVCGTNTIDSHYHNHLERGDYAVFDQTYTSCALGVSKPDVRFWKIIMDVEGVEPENVVFIDDREENVCAAASLGIKAVKFTTAREVASALGVAF